MRSPFAATAAAIVLLAVACAGGGCGETVRPVVAPEPPPKDTCKVRSSSMEPDLMAWDKISRAKLAYLRSQGVVAVRYSASCSNVELELLEHCIAGGRYEYHGYPGGTDKKIARNTGELFATLPLGAVGLSGRMKSGSALRADYTLVGNYFLKADAEYRATDLRGSDCARATHVVSTIYVGGFALVQGETREIEASASVFGIGGGGGDKSALEQITEEGVPAECTRAQLELSEVRQCSIPLRLSLLPIVGRAQGSCPVGTRMENDKCVEASQAAAAPEQAPRAEGEPIVVRAPEEASKEPAADTSATIELLKDALQADQEGRLDDCIKLDRKALAIEEAPRTRLHMSSCESRSGALVDALKDAQKALELGIRQRDAGVMKVARTRVVELLDRIPHVTFTPRDGAVVESLDFDGRTVPLDVMAKKFSVDPGKHTVTASGKIDGRPFRWSDVVSIGERDFVTVGLGPSGIAAR